MKISGKTFRRIRNRAKQIHAARAKRDNRRNDQRGPYQCIVGIMGEVMAWKQTGIGTVDLKVYPDGHSKRTFDGDLAPHVHVKTCNLHFKGKDLDSWTLDKNDPLYTEPDENDIIILVYADSFEDHALGQVVGFVKAADVKELWKPTRKLPHKVAIYKKDLEGKIYPIENIHKIYK